MDGQSGLGRMAWLRQPAHHVVEAQSNERSNLGWRARRRLPTDRDMQVLPGERSRSGQLAWPELHALHAVWVQADGRSVRGGQHDLGRLRTVLCGFGQANGSVLGGCHDRDCLHTMSCWFSGTNSPLQGRWHRTDGPVRLHQHDKEQGLVLALATTPNLPVGHTDPRRHGARAILAMPAAPNRPLGRPEPARHNARAVLAIPSIPNQTVCLPEPR